jgi:iron complex transport system substrate-binding protein
VEKKGIPRSFFVDLGFFMSGFNMRSSYSLLLVKIVFSSIILSLIFFTDILLAQPVTVDQIGRSVQLPPNPQRIVALAPSITEILYALGKEKQLVGVTIFSDYPPAAQALPKVGSYVRLDLERIVALKPDLCIATKDGNPIEIIKRLEALQIPVFAVDPRNLATVMEAIGIIGQITAAQDQARRLVHQMQGRIDFVKQTVARTDRRPRLFFQIGVTPIVSVGSPTFIHELIQVAGGTNLAAGPVPYPRYSREQIIGLSPDVIIITDMAREVIFKQVKQEWERWPGMPAVKHNRIYLVNSDIFDRPTPRLIDGLEVLAKRLHPQLFGEKP